MMLRTSILMFFLLTAGAIVFAADRAAAQAPPPPPPTALPEQALPPPAQRPKTLPTPSTPSPGVPEPPRRIRGRDHNLQIELTISDQSGTETPEKKVVSMLVAESTMGRIRASADAQRTGIPGMVGTGLNVDARPSVIEGDRILLELTVEYLTAPRGHTGRAASDRLARKPQCHSSERQANGRVSGGRPGVRPQDDRRSPRLDREIARPFCFSTGVAYCARCPRAAQICNQHLPDSCWQP